MGTAYFSFKKSAKILQMFNPFDQAFHQSKSLHQNEYPPVRLAPVIQRSQSNSNPIHTQETTRYPSFSEEDLTGPGWQDSESNGTIPTTKGNSINRGRKFLRFLPAGATFEGYAFNEQIENETQCNPTKEFLIQVITEMQDQKIANLPQLTRAHKRSKAKIYSTYAPYQHLIIGYILTRKIPSS